jgi:hypothetical protein
MRGLTFASVVLVILVGCSEEKPRQVSNDPPDSAEAAALESYVMAEKPAKAISVREALTRKDGEKVVVTGRVPGKKVKPYNAAVAAVILMAPEDLDNEDIKAELDCDDAAT